MTTYPKAVADGWHPLAAPKELRKGQPLKRALMGEKLVLFRTDDGIGVLKDRCPHRHVPLSAGKVAPDGIVCPYHGWKFASDGLCKEIPGATTCPAIRADALPVHEAAGMIWTSLAPRPAPFPTLPDAMLDDTLDRFWWRLEPSQAGFLDGLENHLDPAHPHFVHPWLVRAPDKRKKVKVTVRSGPWGAEAHYLEERGNTALLPTAMEGGRSESIGRLWPPTIGEVKFNAKKGAFLSVAVAFVPVDEHTTRPLAHFATARKVLPHWLKRWVLKGLHMPVLSQDRDMLTLQDENRADRPYVIGPLDVLSRAIWAHARGEPCPEEERTLDMML